MSFQKTYQDKKIAFQAELEKYFNSLQNIPELLKKAMAYSLLDGGGKRVRPLLFLECFRVFAGEPTADAIKFAVAVECVHTYSLIHDDLPGMDNDDYRRGRLTNHKVFGDGMAVLAGDALLNLAYEIIFDIAKDASDIAYSQNVLRAGSFFARSMGCRGLIAGQSIDIKVGDSISGDMLKYIFRHKTGNLIIAPCVAGAIIAGAKREEVEKVMQFADWFSYAFQIRDDILDHKEKGKDDTATSFVKVYGTSRASQTLGDSTQKAIKSLLELEGRDTKFLQGIVFKLASRKE